MKQEKQKSMKAVSKELDHALRETIAGFEATTKELSELAPTDAQLHNDILDFIKWCRYFITGVLYWSLESRQYGMASCINADGTLSITL